MQIHLHLTVSDVNLVLQGLTMLPYSQTYQLLRDIQNQAEQQIESGAGPNLTINLTIEQVNRVLQGLSMLPYSEVYQLMDKIRNQAEQQIGDELPAIPGKGDAG